MGECPHYADEVYDLPFARLFKSSLAGFSLSMLDPMNFFAFLFGKRFEMKHFEKFRNSGNLNPLRVSYKNKN